MYMFMPPPDHLHEKDSYVDEYLCIGAVGKANFHCFIIEPSFS